MDVHLPGRRPQKRRRIPEERQARPFLGEVFPCPAGVVGPVEVGLGVGHEAEDPARGVADPGDRIGRAVGVGGVGRRRLAWRRRSSAG